MHGIAASFPAAHRFLWKTAGGAQRIAYSKNAQDDEILRLGAPD